MPAEVGKPAPDFTLRDVDNNPVSLADLKGKKTVLMFIPFPWTGICDAEACAMRDDSGFENEGAQTVIISSRRARDAPSGRACRELTILGTGQGVQAGSRPA